MSTLIFIKILLFLEFCCFQPLNKTVKRTAEDIEGDKDGLADRLTPEEIASIANVSLEGASDVWYEVRHYRLRSPWYFWPIFQILNVLILI